MVAMLVVACFFGGVRFERERYAREMEELIQIVHDTCCGGSELLPDGWRPDEEESQDEVPTVTSRHTFQWKRPAPPRGEISRSRRWLIAIESSVDFPR